MGFSTFAHQITPVSSGACISSYFRPSSHKQPDFHPVLVLLHGYPQNNLMWKYFVDEIPSEWSLFVPDLPSYGLSTKQPSPSGDSLAHSKREWAKDIIEALDSVHNSYGSASPPKIIPYGHDRGARLAYRLVLDFPGRVAGAAVLDIVPTSFVWDAMKLENEHRETKASWHWVRPRVLVMSHFTNGFTKVFLSSPQPFPEKLISSNAEWFFSNIFHRWTGRNKRAESGQMEWVLDSVKPYTDPIAGEARVIGSCEDYRAGATYDLKHDLASGINPSDPARAFQVPLLVLSSVHLRRRFPVDRIWQSLAHGGLVKSYQVGGDDTGHFLVNESQSEVGQRTREWLKDNWSV